MDLNHDLLCSESPGERFKSEVTSYIDQRRSALYSHRAIGEAFRSVPIETLHQQAALRRYASCDALPTASITLAAIRKHPLQRDPLSSQPDSEFSDVFQNAADEQKRFQQAMQRYEETVPESLKTKIRINSKHTWQEVIQAAEAVRDDHYELKGFRSRLGDKLTNSASTVLVWAEILPSQNEYLSPICGGLKLVFGAASKLNKIREGICLAIERVPDVLYRTNSTLEMFKDYGLRPDSLLYQCGEDLMSSVLIVLRRIVDELNKSVSKRTFQSILKQDKYGQPLKEALDNMKSNAERFSAAAKHSSTAAQLDTRKRLNMFRDENRSMHLYTSRQNILTHGYLSEERTLFNSKFAEINSRLNGLDSGLGSVMSTARKLESLDLQKEVIKAALADLFPRFLESGYRYDIRKGHVRELEEERKRLELENRSEHAQQLKMDVVSSVLRYDAAALEADLRMKKFGTNLDQKSQDRAVALMSNATVHEWMSIPSSSVLFVNANCTPSSSPTAYVSAKLAYSIKQAIKGRTTTHQDILVLTFFCAEHTFKLDPDAGPCGLMRSLLAQLLAYHNQSHSLLTLRKVQHVDCEDIEKICSLFRMLVGLLAPDAILFCVIDGITAYETRSAYEADATFLIEFLIKLVQNRSVEPVVKLWFSAPSSSRSLRNLLLRHQIISLPETVPRTGGLFSSKFPMGKDSLVYVPREDNGL